MAESPNQTFIQRHKHLLILCAIAMLLGLAGLFLAFRVMGDAYLFRYAQNQIAESRAEVVAGDRPSAIQRMERLSRISTSALFSDLVFDLAKYELFTHYWAMGDLEKMRSTLAQVHPSADLKGELLAAAELMGFALVFEEKLIGEEITRLLDLLEEIEERLPEEEIQGLSIPIAYAYASDEDFRRFIRYRDRLSKRFPRGEVQERNYSARIQASVNEWLIAERLGESVADGEASCPFCDLIAKLDSPDADENIDRPTFEIYAYLAVYHDHPEDTSIADLYLRRLYEEGREQKANSYVFDVGGAGIGRHALFVMRMTWMPAHFIHGLAEQREERGDQEAADRAWFALLGYYHITNWNLPYEWVFDDLSVRHDMSNFDPGQIPDQLMEVPANVPDHPPSA